MDGEKTIKVELIEDSTGMGQRVILKILIVG
jgi:hypothetical protein